MYYRIVLLLALLLVGYTLSHRDERTKPVVAEERAAGPCIYKLFPTQDQMEALEHMLRIQRGY